MYVLWEKPRIIQLLYQIDFYYKSDFMEIRGLKLEVQLPMMSLW